MESNDIRLYFSLSLILSNVERYIQNLHQYAISIELSSVDDIRMFALYSPRHEKLHSPRSNHPNIHNRALQKREETLTYFPPILTNSRSPTSTNSRSPASTNSIKSSTLTNSPQSKQKSDKKQ